MTPAEIKDKIHTKKTVHQPKIKANDLTHAIIRDLNFVKGVIAWRNNTAGIYSLKRKAFMKNPTTKHGIGDIIGFVKNNNWLGMGARGLFVEIEIKVGKDKLRIEQAEHQKELQLHGCIALVCHDFIDYEIQMASFKRVYDREKEQEKLSNKF